MNRNFVAQRPHTFVLVQVLNIETHASMGEGDWPGDSHGESGKAREGRGRWGGWGRLRKGGGGGEEARGFKRNRRTFITTG